MADLIPMAVPAVWTEQIHQRPPGEPLTGGAPDLANNLGFANVQGQQLASRTAILRAAIDSPIGGAVAAGGLVFAEDGTLWRNDTEAGVTPAGNRSADMLAAGLTDTGMLSTALALAGQFTTARLRHVALYPEIQTATGKATVTAPSAGTVALAATPWLWRGGRALTLPAQNFATVANKTYHLRAAYNPDTGAQTATLNDLADGNYNPGALAESNAAFDADRDGLLLARVVTNGVNVATITTLQNRMRLEDLVEDNGLPTTPYINGSARIVTIALDWARRPDVFLPTFKNISVAVSAGQTEFAAGNAHDHDMVVGGLATAISRTQVSFNVVRDYADSLDVRVLLAA